MTYGKYGLSGRDVIRLFVSIGSLKNRRISSSNLRTKLASTPWLTIWKKPQSEHAAAT